MKLLITILLLTVCVYTTYAQHSAKVDSLTSKAETNIVIAQALFSASGTIGVVGIPSSNYSSGSVVLTVMTSAIGAYYYVASIVCSRKAIEQRAIEQKAAEEKRIASN